MKKYISKKSIYFIGKLWDIKQQLASVQDKSITLEEYIKQQLQQYKNSLN